MFPIMQHLHLKCNFEIYYHNIDLSTLDNILINGSFSIQAFTMTFWKKVHICVHTSTMSGIKRIEKDSISTKIEVKFQNILCL